MNKECRREKLAIAATRIEVRELMQPLSRRKPDPNIAKLRIASDSLEAEVQSLLATLRWICDHTNDPAVEREAIAALQTRPYLRGGK